MLLYVCIVLVHCIDFYYCFFVFGIIVQRRDVLIVSRGIAL